MLALLLLQIKNDSVLIGQNDALSVSIKKIIKQLDNSQSSPSDAIQGSEIEEGTITPDKMSDGTEAGQTIVFKNNMTEIDDGATFTRQGIWDPETDVGVLPFLLISQILMLVIILKLTFFNFI